MRQCNAGATQYCVMVGMFYELTHDASRDSRTRASAFYDQACLKNNADGCYLLSRIYEPHNKVQSDVYQKKACELGYKAACPAPPAEPTPPGAVGSALPVQAPPGEGPAEDPGASP